MSWYQVSLITLSIVNRKIAYCRDLKFPSHVAPYTKDAVKTNDVNYYVRNLFFVLVQKIDLVPKQQKFSLTMQHGAIIRTILNRGRVFVVSKNVIHVHK